MTVITAALPLSGLIGHFGYLAVAGMVFAGGSGVPAPGESVIIAGALYAGSGRHPDVAVVAVVAFLSAVSIGYLIGRSWGRARVLRFCRLVLLTPTCLARLERLMTRRGGGVIAGARFAEGLRQLNGVIAGLTGVSWRRFVAFNASAPPAGSASGPPPATSPATTSPRPWPPPPGTRHVFLSPRPPASPGTR